MPGPEDLHPRQNGGGNLEMVYSTALSVSQPSNEDRQVNNEELQSNERSTSPASSSSIQARLATLLLTVGSNPARRKSTSTRPARSKQNIKSTKGRPSKALVYKDLVLVPSPKINKVPTHTTRLQLDDRLQLGLPAPAPASLVVGQANEFDTVASSEFLSS